MQELDAWIHEKIMGECVHDWEEFVDPTNNKGRICRKCDFYVKLGYFLPIIPPYSADIAEAWKVVDKIYEKNSGLTFKIIRHTKEECYIEIHNRKLYSILHDRLTGDYAHIKNCSFSEIPESICLAIKRTYEKGWLNDR